LDLDEGAATGVLVKVVLGARVDKVEMADEDTDVGRVEDELGFADEVSEQVPNEL
jgi:hypothetical protein